MAYSSYYSRERHHCNLTSSSHTPILTKLMTLGQEVEEERAKMHAQLGQKVLEVSVLKNRLKSLNKNIARETTQCDKNDALLKNQSDTILSLQKQLQHKALEIRDLKLENLKVPKGNKKLLTDQNVCKVCYESQAAAVLMPCRHFYLCKACSLACLKCPFCRTKIEDRIFTFNC